MLRYLLFFPVFMLVFAVSAAVSWAANPWTIAEDARARFIISGFDGDTVTGGLQIQMNPGWHTYWRIPGDSGLPPRFDWSQSENIGDINIGWPHPERMDEMGLTTFGYKDEVTFPVDVALIDPEKEAQLALNLEIMVCDDICVPQMFELSQTLTAEAVNPGNERLLAHKRKRVPTAEERSDLKIEAVVLGPEAIVINAFSQNGFDNADIFPVTADYGFTTAPVITPGRDDPRKAMIRIPKPADIEDLPEFLAGKELSITLVSGRDAIEKTVTF